MKIALVKKQYSLRKGGAERYTVNLARGLKALGHNVTVIGYAIDPELQYEVNFIPVDMRTTSSWAKNLSFAKNASFAVLRGNYDVSMGLCSAPSVDVFRATGRIHAHWMNIRYSNSLYNFLQRLNPRHRAVLELERQVYQRSQFIRKIIAQSKLEHRLLSQFYNVPEHRIEVIYNGVDTNVFHPRVRDQSVNIRMRLGIEPDEPLLVFASAVDFEGKGLRSVFMAMRNMRNRDTRLIVLGQGQQRKFRHLARDLGLSRRVMFLGRQPDIQLYFGVADLFVLPTVYEPFPNVNLEAMACGTPVLTSATSGGTDVITEGENGYVIAHSFAIDEMTERLDHHVSLSSERRRMMSNKSWNTARQLTVENNARRVASLLQNVIQQKQAA